jgi:hypothetical protein
MMDDEFTHPDLDKIISRKNSSSYSSGLYTSKPSMIIAKYIGLKFAQPLIN